MKTNKTVKRKILVSGSNGLLGQKLTDLCLSQPDKYELYATGKGPNRHPARDGYEYVEMDVLDPEQMEATVNRFKPEFVIHTAAMTNVDACEDDQENCTLLNVTSVEFLIRICKKYNIHLIHISTDFIFDGMNGPYREEDIPNPVNFYGLSKLQSEKKLAEASINWTILRTILVYGVVADMSRSNFALWAKNGLEKGVAIRAVNDQWRMPTLAEDLATACLLAVDKNAKGIYHISGSSGGYIHELIREIADFWKLDTQLISEITTDSLNQKAKRPGKTGFYLNKAIGQLGYEPKDFRKGLQTLDQQLKTTQT